MAACGACRALAEGARKDAEWLDDLFREDRDWKDTVLARALAPRRRVPLAWAAAAAALLPALLLLRPREPEPPRQVLARVQTATSTLEGKPFLVSGDVLRTPPGATASILCTDGTKICLNSDSEVVFHDARHVQVRKGEVWTLVASFDRPMRIDVEDGKVTPLGCILDVAVSREESRLSTLSGVALFSDLRGESRTVTTGKSCAIREGRLGGLEAASCEPAWVGPLLMEPAAGMEDAESMLRLVESPRSRKDPEARRLSAGRLSVLAEARHAGGLVGLLSDEDGEVRESAARALGRLSGPGAPAPLPEGAWRRLEGAGLEKACAPWQSWWAAKR